jgi:hypothetical protein
MAKLRQLKKQVAARMLGRGPAVWLDLIFGVYFLLMLTAFTATGIALARGDLPSEKIPNQIASD